MKKRIGILLAMAILIGIPFAAKAAESSETDEKAVKSYGTIVYEDNNGSVRIYAEDIALLQEKLSSIPDEIFDPVLYSHIHVWEYRDVTEQSHTKHCEICGSKYDVTNAHNAASVKECTITYNGHEYPGYEKTCECGYMWKMENGHFLVFTPKDEDSHTQSCALDGTPYCMGMERIDLPHMITIYPTDQTHHQKRCSECGYQGDIEECVFEFDEEEDETSGSEENNSSTKESGKAVTEIKKYCTCGNYITEPVAELISNTSDKDTERKTETFNMESVISEMTKSVSENDCGANDVAVMEKKGESN